MFQNGSKESFKYLFNALVDCKQTLKHVNVQDNKRVNASIPEFVNFIKTCTTLDYLNISDLPMTRSNCKLIAQALIESFKSGSQLKHLEWNYVLSCSPTTAQTFLSDLSAALKSLPKVTLEKVSMSGIFQLKENRDKVRDLFKAAGLNVQLELFKPDYTDDESEDHDCTEDESQEGDDEGKVSADDDDNAEN